MQVSQLGAVLLFPRFRAPRKPCQGDPSVDATTVPSKLVFGSVALPSDQPPQGLGQLALSGALGHCCPLRVSPDPSFAGLSFSALCFCTHPQSWGLCELKLLEWSEGCRLSRAASVSNNSMPCSFLGVCRGHSNSSPRYSSMCAGMWTPQGVSKPRVHPQSSLHPSSSQPWGLGQWLASPPLTRAGSGWFHGPPGSRPTAGQS